jgi:serine/threonine-protein kinase HipA
MAEQVRATWYAIARSAGVSERDCEKIRGAFAYEGFDLIPETGWSMMPGP